MPLMSSRTSSRIARRLLLFPPFSSVLLTFSGYPVFACDMRYQKRAATKLSLCNNLIR